MAKTAPPPAAAAIDDENSIITWLQTHTRELTVGALVVAALGLAGFLYQQSAAKRIVNADAALQAAEQSFAAGNYELAKSDLGKLIPRYSGTGAAAQASMLLAQIHFEQSNFQGAVDVLTAALKDNESGPFGAPILKLLAGAYAQIGKPADAADAYKRAAAASPYAAEKAKFQAQAALAYTTAGNKAAASAIWQDLAKSSDRLVAGEARFRLGELEAKPATKGS